MYYMYIYVCVHTYAHMHIPVSTNNCVLLGLAFLKT